MSRFNAEAILKLAREMSTLEICAICEEEIKRQIMSAKGGNTLVKRYNAAVKYIKAIDENRPQLKGAYPLVYHGKDCQGICNGMTGVILYKPIEGLPLPIGEYIKLDTIINEIPDYYWQPEVDMSAVILATKGIGKHEKAVFQIGKQWFDPRRIVEITSILGDNLVFHLSEERQYSLMSAMYVTNDNGIAIILPLRQ